MARVDPSHEWPLDLTNATGVLGNATLMIAHTPNYVFVLWILTLLLWVTMTYSILPRLMEVDDKPSLEAGLNGAWLLIVVSTQAVSALSALIAPHLPHDAMGPTLFAALCFWLIGVMVYIWLISLIFYRVMFLPLDPVALTPPYWINMGALAISTLGGVVLVSSRQHLTLLVELLPFLKGFTLLCWATATWCRCSWCWVSGGICRDASPSATIIAIGPLSSRWACIPFARHEWRKNSTSLS